MRSDILIKNIRVFQQLISSYILHSECFVFEILCLNLLIFSSFTYLNRKIYMYTKILCMAQFSQIILIS